MKNTVLQIRVDEDTKNKVSILYNSLGLDLSTAIRLFFNKSLSVSNIPFDIVHTNVDIVDKKKQKHTVDDLNKYMGIGKPLYKDVPVDKYIKESRSERS